MESQVNFLVGVLNYKEAWNLFKKTAGACVEEPNFHSLAIDIVHACGGVPIAIVTIAKALRNKHVCEWNNALQELRCPSTRNFEGVARETYSSIEFSYKQLKNEELKSTFLMCSMMGNTHDASIGDLLKYCMGLGIFKSINTVEEARNRVSTFVQILESSSLLLDTNNESFSMHDVVRDVARSIAYRDQHAFTVTDNVVPRDWVDKDTLKNCTAISLHNISELPNDLECPQLKFFYMKATHHSFKIPDNFFSKMLELRVLHIIGVDLLSSPASLRLLVNLRTLYLERCKLGNTTIDGGLKKLEILSLYGSNIVQLAAEIGSLSQLRLLDLTNCSELTVIPPYVLSSLTQLEEVCMGNTSIKWEVEGLYVQRSNASLDELKRLPRLTALELHIGDVKILPKGLLSEKLKKYILVIGDEGHGWFNHTTNDISRTLILERITSTCFGDVVAERQSVNNFLHVLDREGFSELKHLRVNYNPCFFCIADFVESISWDPFSLLESLVLSHLFNLEKVYNGQLGAESFQHLRIIKVDYCDELKNIFSFSTVGGLQKLQEIEVSCCSNMKEIFAIGSEEDIINNEVIDEINYFNELRSITLIRLPRLISFCSRLISEGEVYTPFFNEKVAFPMLERLNISSVASLEKIWRKQVAVDSFCNLKSMEITGCHKVRSVIPLDMCGRLSRLESLSVRNCAFLEEIYDLREIDVEESHSTLVTQLRELRLYDLPNLKHIWNKCPQGKFSFKKLHIVRVSTCQNLKNLFPASIAKDLLQLEELDVKNCGVEEIVAEETEANTPSRFVFPHLTSLKLWDLPQLTTFYPGIHTSEWPILEELYLNRCDKMEIFASDKDHGLGIQGQQPLFLVEKVTFPSLKKIVMSGANKLLTAFQFNMFERFSRLESLTVSNCDSLEQIFGLQGEHFEESHSHSALVTQLKELHIDNLSKLKHIWYKDPQQMFSFQKLQKVRVSHCQRLKSLFPASVAMNLLQLEHLHVHKCGLEEIVTEEREATAVPRFVFPRINALTLKELHELRTFYPGIHSLEWPALKKLEVLDCDKIEILFMSKLFDFHENYEGQLGISVQQPLFMVEKVTFLKLEEIKIRGAHNLKIVWQKQLAEDSFYNLKSIEVEGCNKLRTLSQSNTLEIFLRLESLYVIDCDAIEEIFDLRGINFEKPDHSPAVCELRELNIHKLPKLKHIWNAYPQGMLFSFQKLHKVRVYECQSLKNLFPASIASNLLQLEEVDMYDCGVEEIVARESAFAKAATIRFVFPQMTSLKLKELPQLTTFYPGLHSSEWPVLKKLQVFGCDKIEFLASEQENIIDSQLQISVQPSLFLANKGSFPKLEELELRGEGMKMISGQFSEHLFRKLNFLEVYDVSSAVFPLGILQKFLSLEKLVLNCSLYKEIFSCEKTEKPDRMMLPPIKALHLHNLCELKHIWKQNSELDLILQNLEKLKVMNCDSLTDHLVPSWSYFRNLTILHVWNCNGLRNLVTSTTAKSLMRLVEMRIGDSRMMVEIVANDQGDIATEDEIIFYQLKNLSLYYLPSFTGFCSANYTFKFPSLEQLTVTECPKMKIFSPGVLSTPMLQTLRNSKSGDYIWKGDLNTTIRRMHEEKEFGVHLADA